MQAGGDSQVESVEPNNPSTISDESRISDTSSRNGRYASASDDEAPTPKAARIAARQLQAHVRGLSDGGEIRERITRARTGALNQEAAAGLISTIDPREGGRTHQAILAAKDVGREKTKVPDSLVKEAEPDPASYLAERSSRNSDVWMKGMEVKFDGLEAARTFAGTSDVSKGTTCDVLDLKRLLKWTGDEYNMIESAKILMAAKAYTQKKGVDHFEYFAQSLGGEMSWKMRSWSTAKGSTST